MLVLVTDDDSKHIWSQCLGEKLKQWKRAFFGFQPIWWWLCGVWEQLPSPPKGSTVLLLVTDVIWELAEKIHADKIEIIAPYQIWYQIWSLINGMTKVSAVIRLSHLHHSIFLGLPILNTSLTFLSLIWYGLFSQNCQIGNQSRLPGLDVVSGASVISTALWAVL